MDLIYLFVLISFFASSIAFLAKNIHIYQLNHYKNKFQIEWIIKNKKELALQNVGLLLIIILAFIPNAFSKVLMSIIYIIEAIINMPKKKKSKIPIVYTNRVKRLILTEIIIDLLIIMFVNTLLSQRLVFVILAVLNILIPFKLLLLNFINIPINKTINRRYIKEAKNKIKAMKNLIVIGVTGSYGKTSVKNYLGKLLGSKYNVLITPKNYNTLLGVAKTIRENLKATHEIFVCEMGADSLGEIDEICKLVEPDHGIITAIGPQHLETFGSIENVIKTKFELADNVKENGMVFLNYDNEYIREGKKYDNKEIISYGIENGNISFYAYAIRSTEKGIEFKMKDVNNEEYTFTTKILGEHNVQNLVGCIGMANKLGISMKELVGRVKQIEPVQHRQQLIRSGNNLIIDDAYNSNPSGAKSALKTLSQFDGCKILITPGMIELGEKQNELNYEFGAQAAKVCDYVILVGSKQTESIYNGLVSKKFGVEKLIVVESLKEAMSEANKIDAKSDPKIILLENDLPDNY